MYKNEWSRLLRKFMVLSVLCGCLVFWSSDSGITTTTATACCSSCEAAEEACHNAYPYGSPELTECFRRYVDPCYRTCDTGC